MDREIRLFFPLIPDRAIAAAAEVMRGGWLGLGPRTREFEGRFAEYVGAQRSVAVDSGTTAVHLALRVLDLEPATEVVTTAQTFVSTNYAILYVGATPVFADIDPTTGNVAPESIASRITERTGAILIVHYGGYPCDLDEIYAIARSNGVPVVEDCAHACGATYHGQMIGGYGELHAFSFNPVKNLALPGGGAITLRSDEHLERLHSLRAMGIDHDAYTRFIGEEPSWSYEVRELGFRAALNDVSAAVGLVQLETLDDDNKRRAAIVERYHERLSGIPGLSHLSQTSDRTSSNHLCSVLVEARDALHSKLAAEGIETGVHYRRNDDYVTFERAELPHTEWFWRRQLSLPLHLRLTDEDVDRVCDSIAAGW